MTTPAPDNPVHLAVKGQKITTQCGAPFTPEKWVTDIPHKVTCEVCKKIMQGGQK